MKTITDHILDILQNSTRGGAFQITLLVDTTLRSGYLTFVISDDGFGIPGDMIDCVADPFTTTRKTRRVGLGIPLLRHHARQAGGDALVISDGESGTTVTAFFELDNIDRQPLGNIGEAVTLFITGNPGVNLKFTFTTGKGSFEVSTEAICESIGSEDLNSPEWFGPIRDLINENLAELGASVL